MPRGLNLYDEARLQGRLWTPDLAGAVMSILPADPTTVLLDGSNRSSALRDLSSSRVDFTQADASARPTYVSTGPLPGIQNTGTNWMIRDVGVSVPLSEMTLWMAVMWTGNGTSTFPAFIGAASSPTANDFATGFNIDRGTNQSSNPIPTLSVASPKDSTNNDLLSETIPYNSPVIICARVRDPDGFQRISVNGREQTLSESATTATIDVRVIRLFARYFNSTLQARENGIIGGAFIARGAFGSAVVRAGEGYLAWTCGIQGQLDAAHPFRNRPPLIGD